MRILGVVKEIRKGLVVFKFAFGEENLHSILDGNAINGSECFLDLFKIDIKVVFKARHRSLKVVALAPATIDNKGVNIPSKCFHAYDK